MYKFAFKRRFWPLRTTLIVEGHSYNAQQDKMILFTAEGCQEIARWSRCEAQLGPDWKQHFERMEKERLEREARGG